MQVVCTNSKDRVEQRLPWGGCGAKNVQFCTALKCLWEDEAFPRIDEGVYDAVYWDHVDSIIAKQVLDAMRKTTEAFEAGGGMIR